MYDGGYSADSEAIWRFWRVVHTLSPALQKQLLHFVTGSSRAPIGGLAKVRPREAACRSRAASARASA
jgi:ubiquitin-protein ligase E3 A